MTLLLVLNVLVLNVLASVVNSIAFVMTGEPLNLALALLTAVLAGVLWVLRMDA